MSVRQWWRGRLVAGVPMWHPAHLAVPRHMWPYYTENWVPIRGWPRGVHPSTVYEDYLVWYEEEYAKTFDTPYYKEFPERIPEPAKFVAFYVEWHKYVGPVHRFEKSVPVVEKSVDRWVNILRTRRYRAMPTLDACRETYKALHPDDPLEAPPPLGPSTGSRRVAPEDVGSYL